MRAYVIMIIVIIDIVYTRGSTAVAGKAAIKQPETAHKHGEKSNLVKWQGM